MGAPGSLLSHHPSPKHQILLVEDEPDLRRLLKHILQIKGHTSLEAANGREALPVIHQHPSFRLILSDYLIPGMDGGQVRQACRQNPIKPAIPFIPVTGNRAGQFRDQILGARAFAIMAKSELQADLLHFLKQGYFSQVA